VQDGFRLRGLGEVSRIEALSDGVIAFAITLLVVSLEVPRTFDELLVTMRGFLAFAAAVFVAGTLVRVRSEEKLLRETFGDEYETYARRVRAFIPGLL
jgi:protein-S-isoprenylcysteine O-methyltransferase Ste14